MTIQRPGPPQDLQGGHGTGAVSEFSLNWYDVTYPSSAVYYWIYFWDITAGQTEQEALAGSGGPGCGVGAETCAGQLPVPLPPGTTLMTYRAGRLTIWSSWRLTTCTGS